MSESLEHNHGSTGNYGAKLGHDSFPSGLIDIGNAAWLFGWGGLILLLIVSFFSPGHSFRSLLFASHFWLACSLGCLGFVMISHLTGGGWGVVIRRFGEAGFLNIPLMLIFYVVLFFGYKYLFPWAHIADYKDNPDVKAAYEVLEKRAILYTPFYFLIRTIIYFLIWMALAFSLRSGSLQLDRGPDLGLQRRLRKISAGGIVLFFVTTTGYALDYILSRETNWYSSIIGFILAIGIGQTGMSFMSMNACYFARIRPIKDVINPQHTNDLGNILLALIILFVYTNFAQFLIQWNGNMPEDYLYFWHRGLGTVYNGWRYMAEFLLVFEFFTPFFLLLMKGLKRDTTTFSRIALLIFCMQILYGLWTFAPGGPHREVVPYKGNLIDPSGSSIYWTDLFAFVGVGGLWLSSYLKTLRKETLLALNASDQPEIVTHGTPAHAF